MQEVLGEDPLARHQVKQSLYKDDQPLSRLAWSVRRSMTAMDRASYDSPLVAGKWRLMCGCVWIWVGV
ncbi:hypothetical protein EON63_19220 [archaeon]|nr:MAG: hypothetical protein EON63_19220 [archaeon]